MRRRPPTFYECPLEGPCFVTVYAARFDDNVASTPSRHPDQQGDLEITISGSALPGHLGNQTTLANGMVFRNFTFGNLPDGSFELSDIGSHRIICLTVQGHTPCKTPPLCITIKVRGNKPQFLAPTPPMKVDTVRCLAGYRPAYATSSFCHAQCTHAYIQKLSLDCNRETLQTG